MSHVLILHHSPTRLTASLVQTLGDTASSEWAREYPELLGVAFKAVPAISATAENINDCLGLIIVTPANFGYMSGALKHFFDSHFLALGGALDSPLAPSGPAPTTSSSPPRLPFGLVVHGRYDTVGAVRSVLALTGALPWELVATPLEFLGELTEEDHQSCQELSGTLAAICAPLLGIS